VGDPRLEDKEPEFEDRPAKDRTRKKETSHRICVTFFTNQAKARHNITHFNRGLLNKTITTLRDYGLSYEEIVDYMDYWFARKDQEIRHRRSVADRGPFDLSQWFRQSLNDGMPDVWRREKKSSTAVNSAFGARTFNEKMGLG
jgi:hypothetical protein